MRLKSTIHPNFVKNFAFIITFFLLWLMIVLNDLSLKFPAQDTTRQSIHFEETDAITLERRDKVKEMMLHAWTNYRHFAWGYNELRPLSRRPNSDSVFGESKLGATIVDSLDTLLLMELTDEFDAAREWTRANFSLENVSNELSVFETNIRFVGGFLSAYAMTGDVLFAEKAKHVADKMAPAFETPTGLPQPYFKPAMGSAYGSQTALAELGTLHLEFEYLSKVIGDPVYRNRVEWIRSVIKSKVRPDGLYPNYISPQTGNWGEPNFFLGGLGDSFYEYLLKSWIQSNETDKEAKDMFDAAMEAISENMVRISPAGLLYVGNLHKPDHTNIEPILGKEMEHLACFTGGMFALAAQRDGILGRIYLDFAQELTNTCRESYKRSKTGLGPENFSFKDQSLEAKAVSNDRAFYILRPEVVESYFYLWRVTGDEKYRDWAWDVVLALEKYCRTPNGYSGIRNVDDESPEQDDVQRSYFLAETLKYLYLIFSNNSVIPLDEWVFNTEAHPLPILNTNRI